MSTSLRLTTELKQGFSQRKIMSMTLLQLPRLLLDERISEELETNPVLEWDQNVDSELSDVYDPDDHNKDESNDLFQLEREDEININDNGNNVEDFEVADDFASLYSDTIDEQPARSQDWLENESLRRHDMFGNIPSQGETLQDHLIEQIYWFDLDSEMRMKCEQIIYNLDQNGYLLYSLDELINKNHLSDPSHSSESLTSKPSTVLKTSTNPPKKRKTRQKKTSVVSNQTNEISEQSEEDIAKAKEIKAFEEALAFVQTLDPKGVGARNLKECLLLQVKEGNPYETEVKTLIENHLENLEKNSYRSIAQETGFSFERIQSAVLEIQQLNPRPGAVYSQRSVPTIVPDVYVDLAKDGSLQIRIDHGRETGLTINPYYTEMLKNKQADQQTKQYLRQNIGSAKWFIAAIEQRKTTLIRVVQEILEHQKEFLIQGSTAIRPLTLQQIAEKLDVHASTVSRACDGKWIQTPQGLFPLKKFFVSSIANYSNKKSDYETVNNNELQTDDITQDAACLKVQEIISKENKSQPYSDETIALLLKKEGIKISRRTVTKYRELMSIPDSRKRRVWFPH
ncbi:MAG: RNA polymerase factor sigma-54 [Planctomycetia bacterium]|nr:RNA polymerase factor sigma-54 [Planctomycetia bacterium]